MTLLETEQRHTEQNRRPEASLPKGGARGILPGLIALSALAATFAAGVWFSSPVREKLGLSTPVAASSSAPAGAAQKQLWTCGMHPQVIQDHPGDCPICHMELTPLSGAPTAPVSHDEHAAGPTVTIDPVVVQNMGVRLATADRAPLRRTVRLVGYVVEREPDHRDINLRVGGWIEKLHADTDGMLIAKGQPLFDLYSPQITVAIDELIAAGHAVNRAKQSGDQQAIRVAQTLADASRRKLELWGLTPEQVDDLAKADKAPRTVPILSPIGGHLTAKMVYEGASVEAGTLALRLANRDRMWVEARAFEQHLPLVKQGQPARAYVVAQPGRVYEGAVAFIHPHLDATTRTALVRVEVPNADHALHEGMYASVEVDAPPADAAVMVPREAVLDTGERQVVFVSDGDGRFTPRKVITGLAGNDGRVQILDGINPGDSVVTSGQFLLDSESRLKEAIQKHLSAGLAHANHGGAAPSAPTTAAPAQPTVAVAHSDDLIAAYLEISAALGKMATDDLPVDVTKLVTTAEQSATHTTGDARSLPQAVAVAAKSLHGKPQEEQRRLFQPLSNAIIALARQTGVSASVAPEVVVANCPMAFDDEGADWLQAGKTIANPYYTKSMKRCGTIKDRIATRPQ